jgi:hypothetical protein
MADNANKFWKAMDAPAAHPHGHTLTGADTGVFDGFDELGIKLPSQILDLLSGVFQVNLKKRGEVETVFYEIRISHGGAIIQIKTESGFDRGLPLVNMVSVI